MGNYTLLLLKCMPFAIFFVPLFFIDTVFAGKEKNEEHLKQISQFRSRIQPQIYPNSSLVHKFIRDDNYVYQWLRKSKFNLDRAQKNFMEHLTWRHSQNIDGIDGEDWSRFRIDYPGFLDAVDKYGRPVTEIWLSEWNIRRAVLSGQQKRVVRWMTQLWEITQRKLVDLRQDETKRNISSAVEIIDVEGFNMRQHGCIACFPIFTSLAYIGREHYPGLWKTIYLLNAGPVFRTFLSVGKFVDTEQESTLKMYSDRKQWTQILDREISKNQRSVRFGGSLERN